MTDFEPTLLSHAVCPAPFGWVRVGADEEHVHRVEILQQRPDEDVETNFLATSVCSLLSNWFEGGPWPRDIPLDPAGTDYQRRVWQALLDIPPGSTLTYGALARKLDSGPRAVGAACRRNPAPLLIPCHRVVAARGDGGFAGHTEGLWMDIKRWLLRHD